MTLNNKAKSTYDMTAPKDIISKLHERIGNPILASLFMYLIYIADEDGAINATYTEIGNAFKISKQLVYKYISRLRSVYGVFTNDTQLTISNIGYYRGFSHTSFTGRLHSVDGKDSTKPKKKPMKIEDYLTDNSKMNEVIKMWLDYKKEKKQSYKPIGLVTMIKKLTDLSNGDADIAKQIVEHSIMNNYSGLFALSDSPSSRKQQQEDILKDYI